jgi:hypothetical protein
VASGSPATLAAGRTANESTESLGALWGLRPGKLSTAVIASLDCGIIASYGTPNSGPITLGCSYVSQFYYLFASFFPRYS